MLYDRLPAGGHPLSTSSLTTPAPRHEQKRAFLFLLVLLALILRLVYVPFHLANEEHLEAGAVHPSRDSVMAGQADRDHDHEDGHLPHPAADHASELIADRAPTQQSTILLLALPPGETWSLPAPSTEPGVAGPEPRPPRQWPPRAWRPRGPPAAA